MTLLVVGAIAAAGAAGLAIGYYVMVSLILGEETLDYDF